MAWTSRITSFAVVLAMGSSTAATGCSKDCTEIGCVERIVVSIPGFDPDLKEVMHVEGCVDGRCSRGEITVRDYLGSRYGPLISMSEESVSIELEGDMEPGDSHLVSLTIQRNGSPPLRIEEDVTLIEQQPNGPGCPSTCALGQIELEDS